MRPLLTLSCLLVGMAAAAAATMPLVDMTDAGSWSGANGAHSYTSGNVTVTAYSAANYGVNPPTTPVAADLNFQTNAGIGIQGGRIGFEIDPGNPAGTVNEVLVMEFGVQSRIDSIYLGYFFPNEDENGAAVFTFADGTSARYDFQSGDLASGGGTTPPASTLLGSSMNFLGDGITIGADATTVRNVFQWDLTAIGGLSDVTSIAFFGYSPTTSNDVSEFSLVGVDAVPAPEPGTISLLALAGAAVAMRRKRRS